jgi:hypothetical protein
LNRWQRNKKNSKFPHKKQRQKGKRDSANWDEINNNVTELLEYHPMTKMIGYVIWLLVAAI